MAIAKSAFLQINVFIFAIGIICYTFDILYILCFFSKFKSYCNE